MRAVDTNVLVRLIVRDDETQTAAAQAFVDGGVWVSVLALTETIWVLETVFAFSLNDQLDAIEMLLNHQLVTLEHKSAVAAAMELLRQKPSLGFTDCMLIELARAAGHLPFGTFDRKLARVDGAHRI